MIDLLIVGAGCAVMGVSLLTVFHLIHAQQLLRRRNLAGLLAMMALLATLEVALFTVMDELGWAGWLLVMGIGMILTVVLVLPGLCCALSTPFWLECKLEYLIDNDEWVAAERLLPLAQRAALEDVPEDSHQALMRPHAEANLAEKEGRIQLGKGKYAEAAVTLERALQLAERNERAVDFRSSGRLLSQAYEKLNRDEELRSLVDRLEASWQQAGWKGAGYIRELEEVRRRRGLKERR